MASAGNNQINDSVTLANLFANYGGTDYRNDYKLKTGVWALTAASDTKFVGAFAEVPEPASLGLLGLAGVGMLARRRRRN